MCPHYDKLQNIFNENTGVLSYEVYDTEISDTSLLSQENLQVFENSDTNIEITDMEIETTSLVTPKSNISQTQVSRFTEKLKKGAPKNSLDQLTVIQTERNELQKIRIELEKEKLNKEIEFNERKLQLEEMKIKEEIKLKKLEMEKEERLRKLEIEKQERIQMYEIEMKYKQAN